MLPTGITLKIGNQFFNDPKGLTTRTETNGGFGQCTFNLDNLINLGIKWGDKVVLFDSNINAYPFIGRVQTLNFNKCSVVCTRSTDDQVVRYSTTAQDSIHPSGIMAGKIYPPGTPYVNVLREALQLTPSVFDGGITDPILQLVGPSTNIGGQTAEQIWNYICSLTYSFISPLQWHIRGQNGLEVVVISFADLGARYFVTLPEQQIEETYDLGAIVNRSTVQWGNDDISTVPNIGDPVSYSVIPIIRDKYTNGSVNVADINTAVGLAGNLLTRFGQFESVNDTLTVKCVENPVRIVPPLVSSPNDNWPLHLVEAGHTINLRNRANPYPYNLALKFIVATEYNWETGVLTCRCGRLIDLQGTVTNIVDYNVNRLYHGPASGAFPRWKNSPLVDADIIPFKGPDLSQQPVVDNNQPGDKPMAAGIPMFTNDGTPPNKNNLKYGEVIDPGLIADKGLEINYSFGIDEAGWKGGPWSIPGTLQSVKYSMWRGDTGLVVDRCTVSIYTRKFGDTSNGTLLITLTIIGSEDELILAEPRALPGPDYQVVFKVETAATVAEIINLSLHGKKLYPGLKGQG